MPSITEGRETLARTVVESSGDTAHAVLDAVETGVREGRDPLEVIATLREVINDFRSGV